MMRSASAAPACTTTITGTHATTLNVTSGVTCLVNATQGAPVTVSSGGALSVTSSTVNGIVTATGAASMTYCGSTQSGTLNISGTTGAVTLGDGGGCAPDNIPSSITVSGTAGPVTVSGMKENGTLTLSGNTGGVTLNGISLSGLAYVQNNTGSAPVTVSGNTINGSLYCTGNAPAPGDNGAVNIVSGTATGQCTAISSRTPVSHTAPVLTNIESSPLAYAAGSPPVPVTATLTVSSADATTLAGATVKISSGLVAGEDALGFTNQSGISGSYDASTGVLTLTGTASLASYQAALRSVTYSDSNAAAATGTRTISFQVNDGTSANNLSNVVSRTVSITAAAVHTPPVLTNIETTPLAYTAGAAPEAVTVTLTVSSSDATTLAGATVNITAGLASGDVLGFTTQNGITGSYDATTGALTLTGTASLANYQAALRSVTYSSDAAATGTRTISFQVNDGTSANNLSNTQSRSVTITAAAQAPTATADSYTAVGNTELGVGLLPAGPAVTDTGSVLANDTDPNAGGTLSVTAHTAPAHGTLTTFNADGTFIYLPAAGYTGTDTFTYTVTDSASGKTATATVTITVGTVVWYVDDSASAAGNGEGPTPYNTLAAAASAATASSVIFLYQGSGTYTGGLVMKSGQELWGQPHGLTVDGHSLVAAGGANPVITNSGGDGITLASGTDIEDVNVSGASGNGISGTGVTGTITVKGVTATGSGGDNAVITDTSGALTLTVTGSTFSNSAGTASNGLLVNANGSTDATVSVTGSTFTSSKGSDFYFITNQAATGTNSVTFSNNTVTGGAGGATIVASGTSTATVTVDTNNIQNTPAGNGIGVDAGVNTTSGATVTGTISGNIVGTTTTAGAGNDIGLYTEGTSTETLSITNNKVYQYDNVAGIYAINREGSPTTNLTITGNTIANPGPDALWGLEVQAGAQTGDAGTMCAAISGNAMKGSAPVATGGISDFEVDQEFGTTFRLPGYTGGSTDDAAVVAFVQGNNNSGGTPSGTALNPNTNGTGVFTGGAACPAP